MSTSSKYALIAHEGCMAWCHFEGNDTVLDGSFNIASITDLAVGRFQPNFSNAMASASFPARSQSSNTNIGSSDCTNYAAITYVTTSVEIRTSQNGSLADQNDTCVMVHGDPA